ncbi:MAG TPA: DM13 domain-containing protein [Egibacteraceae bacterium]|nr:DM13 domain-containing protein [Egibacteraceae bacterium]
MTAPLVGGAAVHDRPGGLRLVAGVAILVVMAASAAYSANVEGIRDRFTPPAARLPERSAPPPLIAVPDAEVATPRDFRSRSQPWWQPLTTLSGDGSTTTEVFTVDRNALQWRAAWQCSAGSLTVTPVRADGRALRSLARSDACPAEGTGYSVQTGAHSLRVEASGAWRVTLEQQVDVPLVEPPLPEMASPGSKVLATATMYDVDRVGKGTARIHQLSDGRLVLRLEDFFVSINSDLEIWLSEAAHPRTTPEAAAAPHVQVSFLKATTGAMNYPLPDDVDLSRVRSLVIWCELTKNAYAAATFER